MESQCLGRLSLGMTQSWLAASMGRGTRVILVSARHVKVQNGWFVYSPMLIPRQLRFSLYSGAVITKGLM